MSVIIQIIGFSMRLGASVIIVLRTPSPCRSISFESWSTKRTDSEENSSPEASSTPGPVVLEPPVLWKVVSYP